MNHNILVHENVVHNFINQWVIYYVNSAISLACLYSEYLTRCTAHEPTVVAMWVDSGNKSLHTYIANISQHWVHITWDVEVVNRIVHSFVRSFPICQYMRHMYRNNAPCYGILTVIAISYKLKIWRQLNNIFLNEIFAFWFKIHWSLVCVCVCVCGGGGGGR